LITAIDGQRTGDLIAVANILSRKKPGDRVQLSVVVRRRLGNYTQLQQGAATVQVR
jgi:hypothetical protein